MTLPLASPLLTGAITGYLDVAQIVLYVFFIFFALLVLYLQAESRREGFPLQNDGSDRPRDPMTSWLPRAKAFRLSSGATVTAPNAVRESQDIKAKRMGPWHGAAYLPTGNPMADGVGPAAFANRADIPDRMHNGAPRLVPLRADAAYHIDHHDADPIGMIVVGADGVKAGRIVDVWIDRAEAVIRYLEIDLGAHRVLLPANFASRIDGAKGIVTVNAILGAQFAGVPTTKAADQVTLLEEDKITGYYGGGLLYATPQRAEPVI